MIISDNVEICTYVFKPLMTMHLYNYIFIQIDSDE